jgi:hypothetical protein
MSERAFSELEHDLDQAVARLKATKDPELRRDLLLKMRLLLVEADGLNLEKTKSVSSSLITEPSAARP